MENDMFEFTDVSSTRNNYQKIKKNHISNPFRYHFFANRVINHWNKLSFNAKTANNTNQFKQIIDTELQDLKFVYDD